MMNLDNASSYFIVYAIITELDDGKISRSNEVSTGWVLWCKGSTDTSGPGHFGSKTLRI